MTARPDVFAQRVQALRDRLREHRLDGLFVLNKANRQYLSGFRGTTGWLLITQDDACLLTDGRYWERARQEAPAFRLVPVRRRYEEALQDLLEAVEGRFGFEAETVTVAQYRRALEPIAGIAWEPADEILADLRSRKDASEVAAIRRAAALADAAMRRVPEWLRPGMREADLAWALEKFLREEGAETVAFPIIVAFGAHSASPHAETGETRLEQEMAVCIDLGARVDGYCSDLTRSFWYGTNPDPDYLRAWRAVREAQVAALTAMRPGVSGRLLDALARDTIGRYGYRDAFLHSLGHGVGIEVHESPRLSRLADHVLQAGQVVTVEPGIYLSGRWGIRLEELVVVWDNGPEVLSHAPHWQVVTP